MKFKVIETINNMPGIEINNPRDVVKKFIRSSILNNCILDDVYHLKSQAGAFLQCDSTDYILIEFWLPEFQPFVDWLNNNFERFKDKYGKIYDISD